MVFFVGFPRIFQLQFAEQLVPIIVVGPHTRLVHPADGRGALEDGGRVGGIIVLALAPCATFGHFAVDALLRRLRAAVQREEGAELVLVDAVMDVADNPRLLFPQGVLRETGAGIEIALCIHGQHLARAAPILVLRDAIQWFAQMLRKERAGVIPVIAAIDDGICQLHQLLLEQRIIARFPHILEHAVDVHLVDAEAVKVQHALLYIRKVLAADGHLRAAMRELLQPERDVAHHVGIRAAPVALINAVEVVLPLRAVDGDADGQMVMVLLNEPLHLVRMIVDAVR